MRVLFFLIKELSVITFPNFSEQMLNCIIGLVEKTKRAVSALQRSPGMPSGLLADFVWSPIMSSIDAREQEIVEKKRMGEFLGPLSFDRGAELETRVSEVRRKAGTSRFPFLIVFGLC